VASYQTNEEWILALSRPVDKSAVTYLQKKLTNGLKPALRDHVEAGLDLFVEKVGELAVEQILKDIHTFQGDCRFISWAMKIAVRTGLNLLRKEKHAATVVTRTFSAPQDSQLLLEINSIVDELNAENPGERLQVLRKIFDVIDEELTEDQKVALNAIVIQDLPAPVVVEQLSIDRDTLFNAVYGARRKLKTRFKSEGLKLNDFLTEG